MKIVSFSLWGTQPRYLVGAKRNAVLSTTVYEGWECRFYCAASVPEAVIASLQAYRHVRVIRRPEAGDWTAMMWRFLAAADPEADAVIFRDVDSRLNGRERAAVDAWLASGRPAHVMRDHPHHVAPILGGMWGVRAGVLPDIASLIDRYPQEDRWQIDQEFLRHVVAPRLSADWLEHDEYYARRPFPTTRRGREFVGQPFDEDDRPLMKGQTDLGRRLRQWIEGVLR